MSIVPYQPYPDQPRDPLALAVIPWVQAGWAVESRAAAQVILVSKAPCNHVLHGLLLAANFFIGGTLAACLFWTLIVPVVWFAALIGQGVLWIYLAGQGVTRKILTVDPYGRVHTL